jgi:hypothetical protein
LALKAGEAISNNLKLLAHSFEILQTLSQTQISEVIGAELVAQEGGELFVLLDKRVFEVGAEYVMPVIDAFEGGVKFAAHPFGQALTEDLGDFAAGHAPQTELAGTFEDFADREVPFEDEIPAIFDLGQSVKAAQVH